jgi:hypothetical protein
VKGSCEGGNVGSAGVVKNGVWSVMVEGFFDELSWVKHVFFLKITWQKKTRRPLKNRPNHRFNAHF